MVQQFGTGDFGVINGVLQTAHPLFRRYKHEMQSDALWTEIKYVLQNFVEPLTVLFANTIDLTAQHQGNPDALRTLCAHHGQARRRREWRQPLVQAVGCRG